MELLYKDEGWLGKKYWEEGLSLAEMARLMECNPVTIFRWMKRLNIPRRENLSVLHRSQSVAERFWDKVDTSGDCWEWQGARNGNYGQITIGGKGYLTHRVAWGLIWGAIPKGMWICHHCDNPLCVNPDHLFLGTPKSNSADSIAKGRWAVGERVGSSKLTRSNVLEIRRLYTEGNLLQREIAEKYGVTHQTVSRIVRGELWAWLED